MSLILDALNRSQRERVHRGDVPDLDTQHPAAHLSDAGGWYRWLPWVGLILALTVIAYLMLSREPSVPVARAVLPSTPVAVTPAPTPNIVPVLKVEISKPAKETSAVEALYAARVVEDDAPQLEAVIPPVVEAQEQAIDIEKMLLQAEAGMKNAVLMAHSAPFLAALSQQTKDQIPTIYYSAHNYSTNSSQSFVTLNGESVREGESVAQVLKLQEILPDSIVLSYRDVQFRLRALNSWINL